MVEVEINQEENRNIKKEYELDTNNNKYKLIIQLKSEELIIFELLLISQISYYNYIRKYNYKDIITLLNLNTNVYNNIQNVYNYLININDYKIIDDNNNSKIIKINNNYEIILYKNKNDNIIDILINEINNQNEKINNLIQLNENKNNIIKNLEIKNEKLQEQINNINNLLIQREINLTYECEKEGYQNIIGEEFIWKNENNIELIINGIKSKLIPKYKLNKGQNIIKLIIKNKLTDLSNMFYECKTLKNIEELKYLNTYYCKNFDCMFYGCSSLFELKGLENWNVSNGKYFCHMFMDCTYLRDIKALKNWNVSNGEDFRSLFYGCKFLTDIKSLENWDISNGKYLTNMFYGCSLLKYKELKELEKKWKKKLD